MDECLDYNQNKVIISNIIPRGHKYSEKLIHLSEIIKENCAKTNITLINHNNSNQKRHLNKTKLLGILENFESVPFFHKNFNACFDPSHGIFGNIKTERLEKNKRSSYRPFKCLLYIEVVAEYMKN